VNVIVALSRIRSENQFPLFGMIFFDALSLGYLRQRVGFIAQLIRKPVPTFRAALEGLRYQGFESGFGVFFF
jgi:hypothetical protein